MVLQERLSSGKNSSTGTGTRLGVKWAFRYIKPKSQFSYQWHGQDSCVCCGEAWAKPAKAFNTQRQELCKCDCTIGHQSPKQSETIPCVFVLLYYFLKKHFPLASILPCPGRVLTLGYWWHIEIRHNPPVTYSSYVWTSVCRSLVAVTVGFSLRASKFISSLPGFCLIIYGVCDIVTILQNSQNSNWEHLLLF